MRNLSDSGRPAASSQRKVIYSLTSGNVVANDAPILPESPGVISIYGGLTMEFGVHTKQDVRRSELCIGWHWRDMIESHVVRLTTARRFGSQ